jgi:hypothetical protein
MSSSTTSGRSSSTAAMQAAPVADGPDDLDVLAEQLAQALADQQVVLGEQDSGLQGRWSPNSGRSV